MSRGNEQQKTIHKFTLLLDD